ncbi:MAG TPA: Crp/Fnr family transcriptional regulator [Flavobacteriales bacterium]|nr:Crp/Fnr family transcriptional regulator [Flavobacteriales bacterium]|tara:strand:+ start:60172 stop:60852 length:681 start_codon:yes stop_codon:yes gene_type:complete
MSAETRLWHLKNFNLLESLSQEEKMKMAEMIRDQSIKKGEYIYFPEESSKNIYFLKEGRVKIGSYSDDGKEIIKAILQPGEIFGELSLVGEEKRSDFAQAMDNNVIICSMQMQDMEMMMQQNASLNFKVTKLIGFRLRKVERRLESLIFKDARTRIIDFIKDMAKEQGKKIGDEILVKHFLTHQDIANLTATSRQTVTTVLNDLKDNDLIYMERNKFLIRDINKLE